MKTPQTAGTQAKYKEKTLLAVDIYAETTGEVLLDIKVQTQITIH